ncbi:MAG: DUF4276 family protein [Acidobacteria bacterium]|nr:DUF4276 family protein [Acidobacteriota bacterium]
MKVKVYVEGGGDGKSTLIACRRAFSKLIQKAGLTGRMPGIVACGPRNGAFDRFSTAFGTPGEFPLLLVDSERPVASASEEPASEAAWEHLESSDGWQRPPGATAEQAQLMATCMEAWILADRQGLRTIFGPSLQTGSLPPASTLENREARELQRILKEATRNCGRGKAYRKGLRSFQVLEQVEAEALKRSLPHFRRWIATLSRHLA